MDRKMKCGSMVNITKNPGDYVICGHNPESFSYIYMTVVMEYQFQIVADNWRKKNEMKNMQYK